MTASSTARRHGVARTLSKLGLASRTVASAWVQDGRVAVNGRVVRDPEFPVVQGRDTLAVDGRADEESAMERDSCCSYCCWRSGRAPLPVAAVRPC